MSGTDKIAELSDDELQRVADAPNERELARQEIRRRAQARAARAATDARAAAEKAALAAARAIGSWGATIDEKLARPERVSAADARVANECWGKICRKLELLEALAALFPDMKLPSVPVVVAPGRRGLDPALSLSIASPQRLIFVSTVSDSPERRQALKAHAAREFLTSPKHRDALPDDLLAAIAAAPAPPPPPPPPDDEAERRARREAARAKGSPVRAW